MAANDSCLYTVVKNTSGNERSFGYLPPHGRRLAAGEQLSVPGDLRDVLATKKNRYFQALDRDLLATAIEIVSVPGAIVFDQHKDRSKMLSLSNGTLGTVDPCWGTETGISLT